MIREINTNWSDVSIQFILFTRTRYGHEKDYNPRNANFGPHLKIDRANTGIQGCTHENVVDKVAGHAYLGSGRDRNEINTE